MKANGGHVSSGSKRQANGRSVEEATRKSTRAPLGTRRECAAADTKTARVEAAASNRRVRTVVARPYSKRAMLE